MPHEAESFGDLTANPVNEQSEEDKAVDSPPSTSELTLGAQLTLG